MEPKRGNLTRSRSLKQTDLEQLALLQCTEVHCGGIIAICWLLVPYDENALRLSVWVFDSGWQPCHFLHKIPPLRHCPTIKCSENCSNIFQIHIYAKTNIQIHGFGTLALNRYQMQRKLLRYISLHSTTLKIIRMHLS